MSYARTTWTHAASSESYLIFPCLKCGDPHWMEAPKEGDVVSESFDCGVTITVGPVQ
jgi:hypothetical protein